MPRYRLPGYEKQLLGELQRQQNSAQFCDTLLQTEGISVPTHSCVLAALSPYLSQRLSACPAPPSGQRRHLQLQAVKAQTLLKLVGLLYSGELEVEDDVEQNDVLAAAHMFGIRDLVKGQNDRRVKGGQLPEKMQSCGSCTGMGICAEGRTMQDAQVQVEMAGRRDTDSPPENTSFVSTVTQTVQTNDKSAGGCFTRSSHASTPDSAASLTHSSDLSVTLQPQNISQVCSTSFPFVPSVAAQTGGQSKFDRSSCSANLALSHNTMTSHSSFNNDSNSPTSQDDSSNQQSFDCGNNIQVQNKTRTGLELGKTGEHTADSRDDTEQPHEADGDEIPADRRGKFTQRHANSNLGMKSLAKMQQMLGTRQISVKVKLRRRRTRGEVWEVVSAQDTDEISVLNSQKQDDSNYKGPHIDLTDMQAHPSNVDQPETLSVQPATIVSPKPPAHDFASTQSLEEAPLLQPQASVEESDEQIEKLLEDIMMGLNILPSLERECKKSQLLRPRHDGGLSICQVPVTHNDAGLSQMHTADSAEQCVFYQDLGTHGGLSSTDAGIHCLTAPNQPDTNLSSVQQDTHLRQQQQQRSPRHHSSRHHSSATSMGYRVGMSSQSMPQECLHPESPSTRSARASPLLSVQQKQHSPSLQELSSERRQHILEFLPLVPVNETQTLQAACLSCMDELRLPQCLSPLDPCTSAAKHLAVLSPVNFGDNIHQLPGRPWLTDNPRSVQFPLSAIMHTKGSFAQGTTYSCGLKQPQDFIGGTQAECEGTGTVNELETGQQHLAELILEPKKINKSFKRKSSSAGGSLKLKRKRRKDLSQPQDADFYLAKDMKIADETKGHINLSKCSVSLSSNNVLAKEREKTTSTLSTLSTFIRKPNDLSAVTESLNEKPKVSGVSTDQTRIRTRGFMKKTQQSRSNTFAQTSSVPKPVVCREKTVNNGGVFTIRKRGRPPKVKVLPVGDVKDVQSHNEKSLQQVDKDLSKQDLEKRDNTKTKWVRKRRNRSTGAEMKAISTESTAKTDSNNDVIPALRKLRAPKRPRMVILKEFQRLIKLQHSKTRKSEESKEPNKAVRDAESDVIVCRDGTETKIHVDNTQDGKRSDECPVTFSVTLDENHNEIFIDPTAETEKSHLDETDKSSIMETGLSGEDSLFTRDVLREEGPELAGEREQLVENHEEKLCETGVSNTTQENATSSEDSSQSDVRLLEENRLVPKKVYLEPPESPRSSDPVGMSSASGCDKEEEEDVDVLVYSPDTVPQIMECDNGLQHVQISPDEDEEDDVIEIDVTGDEAE